MGGGVGGIGGDGGQHSAPKPIMHVYTLAGGARVMTLPHGMLRIVIMAGMDVSIRCAASVRCSTLSKYIRILTAFAVESQMGVS